MLGNLAKECGVIDRLSENIKGALMYTVTIFLGLGVGSKLSADKFLNMETIGILVLGMVAFAIGTAGGVLMAKLMNKLSKTPVNPLIGAAGVSAVPMAARVVNKVGLEANPQNHLIMHAHGRQCVGRNRLGGGGRRLAGTAVTQMESYDDTSPETSLV